MSQRLISQAFLTVYSMLQKQNVIYLLLSFSFLLSVTIRCEAKLAINLKLIHMYFV